MQSQCSDTRATCDVSTMPCSMQHDNFHSASFSPQGTMSFGDSKAVFEQRAKAIGLSEDVVTCFRDKSLDTMAKFAFGCNYSPGASDDKPFRELLTKVLSREPTLVEESCLRRLYNESYATVAADIRAQTEQTSEDVHRKLAPADRAARLEEQQARLKGIAIRGPYEPGDSLVDRFVSFMKTTDCNGCHGTCVCHVNMNCLAIRKGINDWLCKALESSNWQHPTRWNLVTRPQRFF